MQISLRSHLIAGTAAMVGASAIAMTPVVATPDLHQPAIPVPSISAEVTLAGFDSPVTELLSSLKLFNLALFATAGPVTLTAPWSDLATVGLLPQIITDALPVIRQLGLNGSDNLYQGVGGLLDSASLLSEGVWNAAGDVLSLDVPGAINTLVTAVQAAGTEALAAGNYVLTGVITRATAVVNTLVSLAPDIAAAVVGQVQVVVGSVVKVVTDTVAALGTANPVENAWNAVVGGLLGPLGVPGTIAAMTVGLGASVPAYVPSVRVVVSSLNTQIAEALATPNPAPKPVAAVAPSASALRAAASEETTTAVASGADESAASDGSAAPGDNDNSGSAQAGSSKGGEHSRSTGGSKRAHKAAD
ncbi:hypothetical protein [Mycobacterium sp. M26]|uniref:hypothetical protein n=1 Tax=Mycobacterium sp. M26 TaxID=1762962 RepID=UPI00073F9F46|nr:hypothetical protein [Mycobacterium sp. M26]